MNWVWTAALIWVALALPLGLAAGIYLRRSDRRDAREAASAHGRPAELPDGTGRTLEPGLRRTRRSGPSRFPGGISHSAAAGRGLHHRLPPSAKDVRDVGSDQEKLIGRTHAGTRGRSPHYRHR
jgi:hypothetical protein